MAINKNAQLRYQILDRCFSNFGRKFTFEDLLDEVNVQLEDLNGTKVSVRQLRADIENLKYRPYCAPIKAYRMGEGNLHYYRYADPNYSIFKNALSPEELTNLRSTIEMLGRYRGIPSNAWLEEVISNLEYRFGVKADSDNLISFEQNEQLKGLEFLSDLIDATVNHQPLSIKYRTFKGAESTHIIHPYYIKQYNNRWFLFGLIPKEGREPSITNYALDRILSVSKVTNINFIPNTFADFHQFFKDIVGVTISEEHPVPEAVVLKFDAAQFPYIVSKPIHPSQVILDEKDHTIRLMIRYNWEMESQIFSFGSHVEVLEPAWLRKHIAEKLAENMKLYS